MPSSHDDLPVTMIPPAGIWILLVLLSLPAALRADPAADLTKFSGFASLDMGKLQEGKILTVKNPLPAPRDLSVETCFIIMVPMQKAGEALRRWDESGHPDLKEYLHGSLSSKLSLDQFSKINSAPGNPAVAALAAATEKLNPQRPQLQMSRTEAANWRKGAAEPGKEGGLPADVSGFWAHLLYQRAVAFAAGGVAKEPPYELEGETVPVADEIQRLLAEQPKIRAQFAELLGPESFIHGGNAAARDWELFDVEGRAAFSLGASSSRSAGGTYQTAELSYYASSGYYAMITLYQMWPIDAGGRAATLVWRGDLLSSPTVGKLHGIERAAAGGAMAKDIRQSIVDFQHDAAP